MLEQAELQETLLHLESAVRLGLITEEEIMQKMIQKFGAEDRDESERMTRAEAEALANKVSDMLEPYADFVEVCGSYRRGREDPGDLDVVVILKEGITLPEIVAELEGNYEKYNWLGEKKTQLVIDGVKVDIKVSTPTGIGATLLYFTGPSGYNIGMRSVASAKVSNLMNTDCLTVILTSISAGQLKKKSMICWVAPISLQKCVLKKALHLFKDQWSLENL